MAEKINLGDFNIDVDQLIKATQEVKQRIDEIKNEQRELQKAGKSSSEAFINNAVSLRELNKEYNAQIKVLADVNKATGKTIPLEQQVDAALNKEAKTIADLRKQNAELTKIRNELNIESEEEIELINQLNARLDENNAKIKDNSSELEQQKIGIGGYADGIKEAVGDIGALNGAYGPLQGTLNDVMGVLRSFTPIFSQLRSDYSSAIAGFSGMSESVAGLSGSQKALAITTIASSNAFKLLRVALISTGIGAIVVALGSLVAFLSSSEAASNKLSRTLSAVGGVVQQLLKYLYPLGEFLLDGIVKGFELAGKAATIAIGTIANMLDALNFNNAADSVRNFNQALAEGARDAQILADAEAKLTEEQRKAGIIQLEYQRQAEKLRQIRDDENLTINDRIAANDRLGEKLAEQLSLEKAIATQALYVANLRIAQDGRNAANLDAQAEAMERIIDIQERIAGQESEQLQNRVSLQKEAADKAREAADAAAQAEAKRQDEAIKRQNELLDLFIAGQGLKARTLEEELEIERQVSDKKKAILDQELAYKKISQEKYNAEILSLNNDLLQKQAELAVDNAERELESLSDRVEIERQANEFVSETRLQGLIEQENLLRDERAKFEALRFEQGVINEQEYRDAIKQINIDSDNAIAQFRQDREAAQLEERELLRQTEFEALQELGVTTFELESAQIEQQRERDLEAARQKYTDEAMLAQAIMNINAQADRSQVLLAQERDRTILQSKSDLLGAISQIVGEETLIGKAAAIAQATINTYLGATQALASLPPPASYIAAAATIATGLASVGKIAGIGANTKKANTNVGQKQSAPELAAPQLEAVPPFARGGVVKTGIPIHRGNGDNVLISAKTGEVVLNSQQQDMLGGSETFRAIGVPGFATGGLVGSSNTTVQNTIIRRIDSQLAETIGDAVREGSQIGTEAGAQKGIVDLSSERQIQNWAAF